MSSSAFTPTTTEVTTEVPVNVPVVTGWQSYTPTLSAGWGTTSGLVAQWMRVGNNIKIRGYFVTGVTAASLATVSFPSGLTSGTLPKSGYNIVGKAYRSGLTATAPSKAYTALMQSNTNVIGFSFSDNGTSSTTDLIVPQNGSALAASDPFHFETDFIPVNEWSSGTTTLADRAVEEYAWNSDTSNASTTGSGFSNGPSGVVIGSYTTSEIIKRVRFTTPILSTDSVLLEVSDGNGWVNGAMLFTYITQGASRYGVWISQVNSTDVDVKFQANGARPTNATYAGAGDAWSGWSTYRWRVRKISGGAQVGFPVSARNIVGDTSGTAVPTGMIGEQLRSTGTTGALVSNTAANITSITLTPGTWDITGICSISASVNPSGTVQNVLAISANSASLTGSVDGDSQVQNGQAPSSGNYNVGMSISQFRVNVTSNTPYYLVVRAFASSSIGTQTATGRISAVRIG